MAIQKNLFKIFSGTPSKKNINKSFLDESFIVKKIPPEWFPLRNRKFWWCAHYSLKAVIEWKNNIKKPIEDYSSDRWSRNTYLMTPRWIIKVLKKYNLKYSILRAKTLSRENKLLLLKENLLKWPIILLVANWQTRKSRFSLWKALIHRHYITLRWYDDKNEIFYVYDSNTRRETEKSIMKWTLKVPYKYILKERWLWASKIIYNNYAIAIRY